MFRIKGIIFLLIIIITTSSKSLGQVKTSLFENSSYWIDNEQVKDSIDLKDTLLFKKTVQPIVLPKFSTLWLKFHIKAKSNYDSTFFIYCYKQDYLQLFQSNGHSLKSLDETGFICPKYRRSVQADISFIQLDLKAGQSDEFLLKIKNFTIENNLLEVFLYQNTDFQKIQIQNSNSLYEKYVVPIFIGIILMFFFFSLVLSFLFREKIYIIYLLYTFIIILRVLTVLDLFEIERFIPYLQHLGFVSTLSQTFAILSFIVYNFFIREFASTASAFPKLDKVIKFQIVFLTGFLFFDFFFSVEKYIIPSYISIFKYLELFGTLVGFITLLGIFKLYNDFNKYLIWGVSFLCIVALVGQEVVKSISSLNRFNQAVYLLPLWAIAYIGEMIFFMIGLINRAAIMKKTINLQTLENNKLLNELTQNRKKDHTVQPKTLSITTTKGTTIIQQSDIYRIEASGNYTIFHIHNQKQVIASYSMADFENKLNTEKFLRVHKSHIINLQYIGKYTRGDGGSLTLHDGTEIPVSRSRKEELIKILFTDN